MSSTIDEQADKNNITQSIKSWLKVDKEIHLLKEGLKDRQKIKKEHTDSLIAIMKKNEIDCFDISDGKIIYGQNNIKKPVNKQHMMECLQKYFGNSNNIQIDEIVKHILDNRTITVKDVIRHKRAKKL